MNQSRMTTLLGRWQEAFEQGIDLSAQDLCPDDPALAERLRPALEQLRHLYRLIASVAVDPAPAEVPAAAAGSSRQVLSTITPRPGDERPVVVLAGVSPPGYQILAELGRGGMGVVYLARQTGLNRLVALKMILHGGHAGTADLARFRMEAEAIARLQHAHIVAVYEVGEHDGKPFFSLEFCSGGSLDRKLTGTPFDPREAANLVRTLAAAMQAAHEAHVIHRDLKPANVLLAADGTPKITDFGLAKRLDEQGLTHTGDVMGTPSYMAPEQAQGKKDVGPAADVYALGAILYELLTGRPPFRAATRMETVMQVTREEPVPPRQLNAQVPRDLETICLKCLHKEPARRYASAAELADDLKRFLAGGPIQARPVGAVERGWRWTRRNPVVAGLAAVVVVLLLAGIAVSTSLALLANRKAEEARAEAVRADGETEKANEEAKRADREAREAKRLAGKEKKAREKAEENEKRADVARHGFQMTAAWQAWRQHDLVAAEVLLGEVRDGFRQAWEYRHLRDLCRRKAMPLSRHADWVTTVCYRPDGRQLVSGSRDRTLKVWDARTGQVLLDLAGHTGTVFSAAYSPDGTRVISGSSDRTLKVWDAVTGRCLLTLQGHAAGVSSAAYSPDGSRIVSGSSDSTLKVWDARTGNELLTLKGHGSPVASVCYSPDGRRIVSGGDDGTARVWDAVVGQHQLTLKGHTGPVRGVAYSPDGRVIVSGSDDGTLRVWDARAGQHLLDLEGHAGPVRGVMFRPDGKRIVSGSADRTVKVWEARSGQLLLTLRGHTGPVRGVAYSPDSRRIVSASGDRTLKVWDTQSSQDILSIRGHRGLVNSVAYSRDGRRIVSGSQDNTLKLWDAHTGQELLTLTGHTDWVNSVAYSPDDKRIVSGSDDNTLRLWDAATGQHLLTLTGHTGPVRSVACSPDGRRIVSASRDNTLKVWDARTGQELLTLKGHTDWALGAGFSPDGRHIVSGSDDRTLKVWDAYTGRRLLTLTGHRSPVWSVAYSPNGRHILSGSGDRTLKVWDARTGQTLLSLTGHTRPVLSACYSSDGRRIVSSSDDGTLKVWDALTGQDLLTLQGHAESVSSVCCSPDGNGIVSSSDDGTLKVWVSASATDGASRLLVDEHRNQRILAARASREFHAAEAETAENNHQPFAAVFHLDRLLLLLLPEQRAPLLERRHRILATVLKDSPHDGWAARALARQTSSDPATTDRMTLLVALGALAKQQGAVNDRDHAVLLLRTGSARDAILVLRAAIRKRGDGPPAEELLLALAHLRQKQPDEARRHLQAAVTWMRRGSEPIRAASLSGLSAAGPLAVLAGLPLRPADPRLLFDPQTAHEVKALRAEVETALQAH
jgi:WD40 repeat protein